MSSTSSWSCDICRKDCDDPVEYGEICVKGSVKSHYYCLLLSTHLMQRGKDTSGILGFYINDIKKEILAAKTRKCGYCKEYYASIKCSCCDIYFHLKCGLQNNCLFQFINEFKSYCHEHHNIQHDKPHSPDAGCFICRKQMKTYNPITSITSNCCSTNGWVHRKCLKIYALAAGYYLKCLWCVDIEFRNYVRLHGVFVPNRDAEWEKIKENYAGLYENLKRKCFAQKCLCPQGRDYKSKKWKIEVCSVCGAFAIHKLCCSDEIAMDNEIICKRCNELSGTKYNIVKQLNETGVHFESTSYDASMFLSKTYWFPADTSFSCKLSQQNTPHFLTSSDEENKEEMNELNKQRIDHTENKTKDNNEDSLLTTFHFNTETLEICKLTKPGDDKESETLISIPKENTIELDNFIHQLFKEEIEAIKKN